ncbi:MAG TPA: hypothetical protein DCG52_01055 [Alphaproteobacteria bacterium]|nr:hypothetical protein [Alphaproteobacteria bacterium]|tara:strand:+ start:1338 stop:2015 length:678 start_codon:yes stop_codon:yes gene_type:complete
MNFNPSAIIFDLDGTLIHSAPDLMEALNHVLVSQGRQGASYNNVKKMIGEGAAKLLEKGLESSGMKEISEKDLQDMTKKFLDFYEENISVHTTLFPFVKETLEQFKQSGIKLGVCTNKMQHFTDKILRDLEIESYFTFVQGATEQGIKKPDPKFLEMLLDEMQVAQESAVMVGDSLNDIVIAKGNNVRCVAVSFGYTKVAPKDLGADAVIDSFKDLPEAIKNLPA